MGRVAHGTVMAGALVIGASVALWVGPPAPSHGDSPPSCATLIADPAPGYKGPMLHGFACDYRPEAPTVSWTVPAGVTETSLHVYGGDHPIGGRGGEVQATLPVAPQETLTLAMGSGGGASSVSRGTIPLLVAGGGDGQAANYVDPAASRVSAEPPGRPNPPYPSDGRIYASWYEGYVEIPDERCVVPSLRGRRPRTARGLLVAASCTTGRVSRRPSRRALRGRVVGQSVRPDTGLPLGTPVGFAVGRRP